MGRPAHLGESNRAVRAGELELGGEGFARRLVAARCWDIGLDILFVAVTDQRRRSNCRGAESPGIVRRRTSCLGGPGV